ncbi:MAG: DNA topoisomerase [Planctomycetota bacterium]
MVRLFVTEKPSVARDLARVLLREGGRVREQDGALRGHDAEGREAWVTWCLGHLVEIAEPHEQDPRWRRWDPGALPMLPDALRLRPVARTRERWSSVRALLRDGRVREVVNACDAGREGELIFRYVYEHAGCRRPVRRLWLSSLTPAAIRAGLGALRPGVELDPLAAAARCRAEADWLVGMNATRGYTSRSSGLLSLGRVQTPTLALIVTREQEIERFVSVPYWVVDAELEAEGPEGPAGWDGARWKARWLASGSRVQGRGAARGGEARVEGARGEQEAWPAARVGSEAEALAIAAKLRGQPGEVVAVERREESVPPPQLHHLTSLQQEANRRHGLTADQTLAAAQRLYERHKLITYPRTDSRHLTRDVAAALEPVVAVVAVAGAPWTAAAHGLLASGLPRLGRRFVDDAEVGDHHALIPTASAPALARLDRDEARVYELIVRRFLAAFFPPARYARARIDARVAGELLRAEGRVRLEPGWEAVEPPARRAAGGAARARGMRGGGDGSDAREEPELPAVAEGDPCRCLSAAAERKETQPPRRYTEAALLGAMERGGLPRGSGEASAPAGGVSERELRAALRDQGLGTPATRAATIETLLRRRYLGRSGKLLVPTPTGRALIEGLPVESLRSARLTGEWEARLARIARGAEDPAGFRRDLRRYVEEAVRALLAAPRITLPEGAPSRGGPPRGGPSRGGPSRGGPSRGGPSRGGPSGGPSRGGPPGRGPGRGPAGNGAPRRGPASQRGSSSARARGSRARGGRRPPAASPAEARGPARSPGAREPGGRAWRAEQAARGASASARVAGRSRGDRARAPDAPPEEAPPRRTCDVDPPVPRPTHAALAALVASNPRAPTADSAAGPRCRACRRGRIVRGRRGWGCDRWREGCRLVVWFEHEGVAIPSSEAERLFRQGKTRLFATHPRSGQRARLVLAPGEEGNVRWETSARGKGRGSTAR